MSEFINGPSIQLASGDYFHLEYMNVKDVHITDVAISLSRLCRFNGHCSYFYSVAQHCCLCMDNAPKHRQWDALMHDCAETIIGDIARPIKYAIPGFKELEKSIEEPMLKRFGVSVDLVIKSIDIEALTTERRDLMPDTGEIWGITEGVFPWPERINPWSPDRACTEFLDRVKTFA